MGGKKKPKTPRNTADNLFSQDLVEMVFGICEGTIYGLKEGLKSFYINGLPVMGETGDLNFQDVAINLRQGYHDDQPIKFFAGGETSVIPASGGLSLPAEVARTVITPAQYRGAVKGLDVRIMISQLFAGNGTDIDESSVIFEVKYRKVGETSWRYVNETTQSLSEYKRKVATLRQAAINQGLDFDAMTTAEQYDFELSVLKELDNIVSEDLDNINLPSETYQQVDTRNVSFLVRALYNRRIIKIKKTYTVDLNTKYLGQLPAGVTTSQIQNEMIVVSGKTTAGYIYELHIPIFDDESANHDWEVQVIRRSKELTAKEKKFSGKEIGLESIAVVTANEKAYPKTAICQIVAQHTDRFDDIPEFAAEIMGLMCDIPTNYNPFTKTWSGVWDGTFKRGWTDNNALIAREIIMNRDWGKRASEPQLRVDNTSLREAIFYCDELVPDLESNLKPRHTFNDVVSAERDIDDYLKYVLGSFHATCRELFGVYRIFIDKPKQARFFVSPETVFQNGLSYYRSDLTSRYNMIRVIFGNASNDYQEDRRVLLDEESQLVNGIIPYAFQSVGATNLSEAIRQAVYLMYTNKEETTFLTFSQPRLGHVVDLYDNFYVFDKELDWGLGTRILSYDEITHIVTLRDALVQLGDVENYTMYLHTPTDVLQVSVASINRHQLQLTDLTDAAEIAMCLTAIENAPIGLEGGVYGTPKTFRILSVEQSDSADVAQGEMFTIKAAIVAPLKYEAINNIDNPTLVNFKYNSVDLTYKKNTIPSVPFNVKVWLREAANELGQESYGIQFTAADTAAKYQVLWVNKNTGESRETVLYSKEGVLAPAFPDTVALKLKITPYNASGDAGETLIMDHILLERAQASGLPRLLSSAYYAPTQSIRFSFSAADFAPHTDLIYSQVVAEYSQPNGVVSSSNISVGATNFDIPYVGQGVYRLNLKFSALAAENNGATDVQETPIWFFRDTGSGSPAVNKYPVPTILAVESYTRARKDWSVRDSTTGKVFVRVVLQIPNYNSYPLIESKVQNDAAFSPFFFLCSDADDTVYRTSGYYARAYKIPNAGVGVFEVFLESTVGLTVPDETLIGARLKVKVTDKSGTHSGDPNYTYNNLDSNYTEVVVPDISTNGFNPIATYNASST